MNIDKVPLPVEETIIHVYIFPISFSTPNLCGIESEMCSEKEGKRTPNTTVFLDMVTAQICLSSLYVGIEWIEWSKLLVVFYHFISKVMMQKCQKPDFSN